MRPSHPIAGAEKDLARAIARYRSAVLPIIEELRGVNAPMGTWLAQTAGWHELAAEPGSLMTFKLQQLRDAGWLAE
jgi:hypothetical protein